MKMPNLLRVLSVAIGLLIASPSIAATLYITEYANGLSQVGSTQPQIPPAPAITTQQVAVGGASVQSSAFSSSPKTNAISVICDVGCSVAIGTNPTAATSGTSSTLLQQGVTYTFGVVPGNKIAVIANTAGDTPGGGGATTDVNVAEWGGTATTLGQKAMAASVPVAIASNQSAVTVTGSGGTFPATITTCGVAATDLCKAEDAVAGSGDTGIAVYGVQQTTPADTAADGDYTGPQYKDGALWTQPAPSARAAAGITSVSTSAVASNLVVKNSPGNLYGFSVTTGATAGYVFVSNTTTAPTAGGAAITPVKCYTIAANSTVGVTYSPPLVLSTGVTLVFSTTGCFTNTASATAFISGDAK